MRLSSVALFLASALTMVLSAPIAVDGIIARGVGGVAREAEAGPVIEWKRAHGPLSQPDLRRAPEPTQPDWRRAPEPTQVDWKREPSPQGDPDWRREPSAQIGDSD